jgi:hypothetical protein
MVHIFHGGTGIMYLFATNNVAFVRDGRPPAAVTLVLTGLAAVLIVFGTRWTRHLDTAAHEGGHALVAFLAGRKVTGIRITGDGGVTETVGRAAGPGMVITAAAGYTATPAVGLFSAAMLAAGRTTAVLILAMLALILLLLLARNLLGILVAVGVGGSLIAVVHYCPGAVQAGYAAFLTWILLLSAPKSVLVMQRVRRARDSDGGGKDDDGKEDGKGSKDGKRGAKAGGKPGGGKSGGKDGGGKSKGKDADDGADEVKTDADLLAELTHVPAFLWVLAFGVFSVWCAYEGVRVLLLGASL